MTYVSIPFFNQLPLVTIIPPLSQAITTLSILLCLFSHFPRPTTHFFSTRPSPKSSQCVIIISRGSVSEWFKEHAWKACRLARVSQVRILPLPPFYCTGGSLSRAARFFLPLASAIFLYHRFVTERSEVTFPATSAILLYQRFVISRSEIFSSSRFRFSHPFTTFFVTSNFSIYFPTINRVCA